jgi:hypothetical protein
MRLNEEFQALMGGRTYVKEEELTRDVLLEFAKCKGAVTEVHLISVSVHMMGGSEIVVALDDTKNKVTCLKCCLQNQLGIPMFMQQLFVVSKSGGNSAVVCEELAKAPLGDDELIEGPCSVFLCVTGSQDNEWDPSSPLLSVGGYCLSAYVFSLDLTHWNNYCRRRSVSLLEMTTVLSSI